MIYLPGQIHESLQKPHYYEVSQNFSFAVSSVRCRLAIAYIPELLVNKRDRKIEEIIK